MDSFEKILLRLKEAVGLAQDKDVAELLGMNGRAFTARKTRGSFPEDKLLALKALRPDLKLDVSYILTGVRLDPLAAAVLQTSEYANRLLSEFKTEAQKDISEPEAKYDNRVVALVRGFNLLDEDQKTVIEATIAAFLNKLK